jgi:hypothetical protein
VSITTPPGAPSSFAATSTTTTPTSSTVNLTWSNGSNPAGSVILVRASDAGFTTALVTNTLSGNTTSYADTTAVPSTQYWYKAYASNANGTSVASSTVAITTGAFTLIPTAPVLSTPTAATTSATQSTVSLTWANGNVPQTSVVLVRASNAGFTSGLITNSVAGTATSYSDSTAVPSTQYWYRAYGVNANGASPASTAVTITTPAVLPSTPTGLTAVATGNATSSSVTLTWVNGSMPQTSLLISRATNPNFTGQVNTFTVNSGTATNYTDTTAVNNTAYSYRIQAVNAAGSSPASAVVTVTTPPAAPIGFTALASTIAGTTTDKVTLTWAKGSPFTNPSNGYNVQRATDANFTTGVVNFNVANGQTGLSATATSFVDGTATGTTPLPKATKYWYRIQALGAGGNSPYVNSLLGGVTTP